MSGSQYKKEDASWGMLLKGRNSLKSLALAGEWHYMLLMSISPLPPYLLLFVISGA